MRNKFAGNCYQCGKLVPAGAGYFERDQKAHVWKVQHRECCWEARRQAEEKRIEAANDHANQVEAEHGTLFALEHKL